MNEPTPARDSLPVRVPYATLTQQPTPQQQPTHSPDTASPWAAQVSAMYNTRNDKGAGQ